MQDMGTHATPAQHHEVPCNTLLSCTLCAWLLPYSAWTTSPPKAAHAARRDTFSSVAARMRCSAAAGARSTTGAAGEPHCIASLCSLRVPHSMHGHVSGSVSMAAHQRALAVVWAQLVGLVDDDARQVELVPWARRARSALTRQQRLLHPDSAIPFSVDNSLQAELQARSIWPNTPSQQAQAKPARRIKSAPPANHNPEGALLQDESEACSRNPGGCACLAQTPELVGRTGPVQVH